MNCAAYYPKTPRVQACTCSASLIEHMPVMNAYRSPATLPYGADTIPSNVNTSTRDATNTLSMPVPMPAPSTNGYPSHSYGEILTPARNPSIMSQIDTHSHSEIGDFYIAQNQNDNSGVFNKVQDSSVNFREDRLTAYDLVHGEEAWAGYHPSPAPSLFSV
ncbi:hypothetical protein F5146DRAFT_1146195 [Armillaria mellea]|nr:hypothetical protein F5146DRAFT_1146195 [Armillaria mellea]